ncbi:NAD(P)H-dependent oxidoreductase [Hahella sp. HN01]|uniref:NADPH-dependent FMN reductase n=1 Tax=Hahella sp. HN01 TaxID=2847262 RepID=UPI001C1F11CD|nr:NAD(P)H-dependent oxidoreductase [Hahella sp. HN01]
MSKPKILVFAGSLRKDSLNKKLARAAGRYAEAAGAEVTFLDLADYPLPIYDGDIESASGLPENALKLKQILAAHDGFILSSPEYNGGISGVLKNMIDWVSRPLEGEPSMAAFKDKWVALLAASPGALGGIRALPMVRTILSGIGCVMMPEQVALGQANKVIDAEGAITDKAAASRVQRLSERLVRFAAK